MNYQQQVPPVQHINNNGIPTNSIPPGDQIFYMPEQHGFNQIPHMQPPLHQPPPNNPYQAIYYQSNGINTAPPHAAQLFQSYYDFHVNSYYNQMGQMPAMFYNQTHPPPHHPTAFFPPAPFMYSMAPNLYQPPPQHLPHNLQQQQTRPPSTSNSSPAEFTLQYPPPQLPQQPISQYHAINDHQPIKPYTATLANNMGPKVPLIVDPKTNQTISPMVKTTPHKPRNEEPSVNAKQTTVNDAKKSSKQEDINTIIEKLKSNSICRTTTESKKTVNNLSPITITPDLVNIDKPQSPPSAIVTKPELPALSSVTPIPIIADTVKPLSPPVAPSKPPSSPVTIAKQTTTVPAPQSPPLPSTPIVNTNNNHANNNKTVSPVPNASGPNTSSYRQPGNSSYHSHGTRVPAPHSTGNRPHSWASLPPPPPPSSKPTVSVPLLVDTTRPPPTLVNNKIQSANGDLIRPNNLRYPPSISGGNGRFPSQGGLLRGPPPSHPQQSSQRHQRSTQNRHSSASSVHKFRENRPRPTGYANATTPTTGVNAGKNQQSSPRIPTIPATAPTVPAVAHPPPPPPPPTQPPISARLQGPNSPVGPAQTPSVGGTMWSSVLKKPANSTKTAAPASNDESPNPMKSSGDNNTTQSPKPPLPNVAPTQTYANNRASVSIASSKLLNNDKNSKLCRIIGEYKTSSLPISVNPKGITNVANWCYVNATLQALLACPEYVNLITELPHVNKKESDKQSENQCPLLDSMVIFFSKLSIIHSSLKTLAKPVLQCEVIDAHDVYSIIKSQFHAGREEDAEELLSYLLNTLNDECLKFMPSTNGVDTSTESDSNDNNNLDDSERWQEASRKRQKYVPRMNNYKVSPVSEIFRGMLLYTFSQQGGIDSPTIQPFFTLQLDIKSEKVLSVKDAINGFMQKEIIEDYICPKTKLKVAASRRTVIDLLPNILILHLKSFQFDGTRISKIIDKHVNFSMELHIQKEWMSKSACLKYPETKRKYSLFAVCSHHGQQTDGSGHYTTDALYGEQWLRFDDARVTTVNIRSVIESSLPTVPYLLYYRLA